jgi:acyl dehydratase
VSALHYEELEVGAEYRPAARTITEAEVMAFAGLSGDTNPVHTDAIFAADSRFGARIAHGLLGLAAAGGFLSRAGVVDGTAVALLDVDWHFRAPIHLGDTIAATIVVAAKRPTSNPTAGLVTFAFTVTNQAGDLVQEGEHLFLVKRLPAGDPARTD